MFTNAHRAACFDCVFTNVLSLNRVEGYRCLGCCRNLIVAFNSCVEIAVDNTKCQYAKNIQFIILRRSLLIINTLIAVGCSWYSVFKT